MRDRVDIMINKKCNIKCLFCYHNGFEDDERYDFSLVKIEDILKKGSLENLKELYISGGEPTIDKNIVEVVKIAKAYGYEKIKIMTNGIRLSDYDFCKDLYDAGVTNLAISMHGYNQEEYEYHSGVKGTYPKFISGIINAIKFFDIDINVVVTNVNIKNLNKLGKLILTLGYKRIHLQHVVPNSFNNIKLLPTELEVKIYVNNFIENFKDKLDITLEFFPYCLISDGNLLGRFDFKEDFFTNNQVMFDNWSSGVLKNRILKNKCKDCNDLQYCNGFWK